MKCVVCDRKLEYGDQVVICEDCKGSPAPPLSELQALKELITKHLTSQTKSLESIEKILVVSAVPQELYENGINLLATMRTMNTVLTNIVSIGTSTPTYKPPNQKDLFPEKEPE